MDGTQFAAALTIAAIAIAVIVAFGWMLVIAGRLAHPGPIVVSLSLLTVIALVGGIATGRPEVLTLAATGIGALAGSLAAIYRQDRNPPDDTPSGPSSTLDE